MLKKIFFLTLSIFLLFTLLVFAAPFSPTILTIEGQNVSGGQMAYTNKIVNIQVSGNSEGYKKINEFPNYYSNGDKSLLFGKELK